MSAYSTMSITREDAEYELLKRGLSIPKSDCELEDKLFQLWGNQTLYNFRIVYDYGIGSHYSFQHVRGQFDYVDTPGKILETTKPYKYCPHCGEEL